MSKPDQAKGAKKSPTAKDGNLTAQHFAVGDKITTKFGKSGVVTHIHGKAGYLFIHNKEQGKTYHVSWGSVTSIDGQNVADIPKQGKGDGLGEDVKAAADKMVGKQSATEDWKSPAGKAILEAANKPAEGPAATALKSHGWKPVKKDSMGAVTFAHPKVGGQFHVDADGTLINATSGTEIKPDQAAEYLRAFHSNSEKQAEGAAKQKTWAKMVGDEGGGAAHANRLARYSLNVTYPATNKMPMSNAGRVPTAISGFRASFGLMRAPPVPHDSA